MMMLLTAWAIVCLSAPMIWSADVRMPPSILESNIAHRVYRPEDTIQLDCVAVGTPKPSCDWKKNGRSLVPASNVQHVSECSIFISPLTSLDEGMYQCLASNMWGTAMSNVTYLQRAVLHPYGQPSIEEKRGMREGQPYILNNIPTKCIPKPTFTWGIAADIVDNTQVAIIPDKRVQIDEDGNLHFSYLTLSDMQNSKLYKCNIYNPYLDMTHGGSYSRLHIEPSGGLKPFGPVLGFASQPTVIALEGRNVSIRCFFSGYPDPSITWKKVGGSLPMGRYSIINHNTEFVIRNVQQLDEGDYECIGSNANGNQHHVIQIDVQASPVFRALGDRPHNINVTEGDRLVINCNASAEPKASVVWYKNGEALDPAKLPPKMSLVKGGLQLVLSDVCKECQDGSSDLQVIQCNASNVHGYAFGDGYINVLQKTKIVDQPQNLHLAYYETTAKFSCQADSDDSTPVTFTWYHRRVKDDERPLRNITDRVAISENGQTLTLTVPENMTEAWAKLRGDYRCEASNGYSRESVIATLVVDYPPITDDVTVMPAGEPLAAASIGDWWWLFVVLVLLLLLIILLICCCICLQRRRGDTYKVDEKERKNGNDPEKELADSGFHDYRRPDSEPLKGSRASLVSSSKLSDDDDASSLNEYGDIDAGKFTEDGSFIGDYGTEQRPRRARANDSVA